MNKGLSFVLSCLLSLFAAAWADAQQPTAPRPTPSPTAAEQLDPDTSGDDILILANITAKELRFEAVPNTSVEFPGTHKRTNIWITQRQNLPDQVQPGVTYRDVGLQLRISTRFSEIERIVREVLDGRPAGPADPAAEAAPAEASPAENQPRAAAAPVKRIQRGRRPRR
ncbi:MAG: hypothetical protein ACK4S4_03475 [Pyrinomonadaceae bacterium]